MAPDAFVSSTAPAEEQMNAPLFRIHDDKCAAWASPFALYRVVLGKREPRAVWRDEARTMKGWPKIAKCWCRCHRAQRRAGVPTITGNASDRPIIRKPLRIPPLRRDAGPRKSQIHAQAVDRREVGDCFAIDELSTRRQQGSPMSVEPAIEGKHPLSASF
jgi:hypothetical protein